MQVRLKGWALQAFLNWHENNTEKNMIREGLIGA